MSVENCESSASQLNSSLKKKKKTISNYNKKQLLIMLKESNCRPKQMGAMTSRFRVDADVIKSFINTQAEIAQARLEKTLQMRHNKHFLNLDECAKNIIEFDEPATDNTLPVTLEAITNLEEHPPPSEVNEIDLKALYQMLANMTAGYPVDELEDGPTKEFLKQCYTELMDSVSELQPKAFRDVLAEQDKQTQPVYSWLCNSDYSHYLNRIFKDMCNESDEE